MKKIGVIHIIDTLELGGAERMAVSLANHMSRSRFRPFLCVTRREGPLKDDIKSDIGYLCLYRKSMFNVPGLLKIIYFIRKNQIQIIHAHSFGLFLGAIITTVFFHNVKLIWHDHYGLAEIKPRNPLYYRLAIRKCDAIIAVNTQLVTWVREKIGVQNVFYIPNFAETKEQELTEVSLPGKPEKRIICVANLRPEKDQETLLKAMLLLLEIDPDAHLILVGAPVNEKYAAFIQAQIINLDLENHVTWLGSRNDVPNLLHQCAIGVLSSRSEGLPVALMEYGSAGMAVVATNVGQCGELIVNDKTGILIEPGDAHAMANAITKLLHDVPLRHSLGKKFLLMITERYSAQNIISQVESVYDLVHSFHH